MSSKQPNLVVAYLQMLCSRICFRDNSGAASSIQIDLLLPTLVFEITTPGHQLDSDDREWYSRIEILLDHLKSQFFEANVALNLFMQARKEVNQPPDRVLIAQDRQRRSEISSELRQALDLNASLEQLDASSFDAEVQFKREQWSKSRLPSEFKNKPQLIYAKAFLYALDTFEKLLAILVKQAGVPPEIAEIHKQMAMAFPDLLEVRNSAHHLEDRVRGFGRNEKQTLELKPIENQFINAPNGGILALNNLNGSKYGSIMVNGIYGEVDVVPESMEKLKKILQEVLDSFEWRKPKDHAPHLY